VTSAERFVKRAAEAKRSSKRVELKERFDPNANDAQLELVRDVAAMANSGGGVVVLAGGDVEEELIHERLARYAEPEFEDLTLEEVTRGGRPATAVVVEAATTPLVFTRQGRYRAPDGAEPLLPSWREERTGDGRGRP
jgi:hypothetical protein